MIDYQQDTTKQSSPTWGRGLKLEYNLQMSDIGESSSTWGRGLKHFVG